MEWKSSQSLVPYEESLALMEARVAEIRAGTADEMLWLLEHPPVYTAGTSAKQDDLLTPERFPVYQAGRGGQYTYHGPGQRVGYVMLDLKKRAAMRGETVPDVRRYVQSLEAWLIDALKYWGVVGELRDGRVGIWVDTPRGECKIAALGMRIRQGVSYHGVALNVCPDLTHFEGIVPCGLPQYGVTSLAQLGVNVSMTEVDAVLMDGFKRMVGMDVCPL
jgi:lipoyl(octanoyl) transferase